MSAWSILTGNSTAPASSTAWVHLNNQAGGGGTVIVGGIRTANISQALSTNIGLALSAGLNFLTLTTDKPTVLSANVSQKLEAAICQ